MCGRYTIHSSLEEVAKEFNAVPPERPFGKKYNAAPSQNLPVIIENDRREIKFCSWGLVPEWAQKDIMPSRFINARCETVAEKPSFKKAFLHRRCIVPANGFFEWQKTDSGKKPVYIYAKNNLFAFAGLWECWQQQEGILHTFTVLTTEPNELVRPIHNRMPVILSSEKDQQLWLNKGASPEECLKILKPCSENEMATIYVSTKVNNTENDFPELLQPIIPEVQNLLFE